MYSQNLTLPDTSNIPQLFNATLLELYLCFTKDGFIASLPYLVEFIAMNLSSVLADKLRERGTLNTTQTRKIFTSIGKYYDIDVILKSFLDTLCIWILVIYHTIF